MNQKKNDKLFILEGDLNAVNVEKLVMAFREELKPIGTELKNWAKAN